MGTFYIGLRTDDLPSLLYPSLFLGRRFLVAAVFRYIPIFSVQVGLHQVLSIMVIWYLMTYKPYKDPNMTKLELMNEIWLMVSTDTFFLYTDNTPLKFRFKYGIVFIALLVIGWLANITWLVIGKTKAYCVKRKAL